MRYNGNIFLKSLDGSDIIRTDLLLREAVQNSYDAKKSPDSPVDFYLNGINLDKDQSTYLSTFLRGVEGAAAKALAEDITDGLFCLEVADKGTVGLQGPCQQYDSEGIIIEAEAYNYRDFVLMMGGSKDGQSGGIFGIGKASFFLVSKFHAVIIYSRTEYLGEPETRLIVRFFREDSKGEMQKYWIGDWNEDKHPKERSPYPFINEKADFFAKNLGMMEYSADEYGTSILILGCNLENEREEEVAKSPELVLSEFVPKRIPHWFWPKMITPNVNETIRFHVALNGFDIPIKSPEDGSSPYFYYGFPYHTWKREGSEGDGMIECKRPKVTLGRVTTHKTSSLRTSEVDELFGEGNNVCLAYMRNVELIVRYETFYVSGIGSELLYAMFHTDPNSHANDEKAGSVEKAFREAENQTHDRWSENQVHDRQRTYVRVGLKRIKDFLKENYDTPNIPVGSSEVSTTLAGMIGSFLPYGSGSGASRRRSSPSSGGGGGPKKQNVNATFELVGIPEFLDDGEVVRRIIYRIRAKKREKPIRPVVLVVLADGRRTNELDLVVLEDIYFSTEKDTNSKERASYTNGILTLEKEGFYFFSFKVTGNVVFECKLLEASNE
ncbi:MAG: hypothetical protein RBR15_00815 [Sphaerochaeta sp.]|nr:hypothetical protein [Sphaerochaeta sp.]